MCAHMCGYPLPFLYGAPSAVAIIRNGHLCKQRHIAFVGTVDLTASGEAAIVHGTVNSHLRRVLVLVGVVDQVHLTCCSLSLTLSRMEERVASCPSLSSRSRAILFLFTLLGGALLLAVVLQAKIQQLFPRATGSGRRGGEPTAAFDHSSTSSCGPTSLCGPEFDPLSWEGPAGETGDTMENAGCNINTGGAVRRRHGPIPFFGSTEDDTMRKTWSHLNHRIEEYRDDLVKAVEVSSVIAAFALISPHQNRP